MITGPIYTIFKCSGSRNKMLFHGVTITVSAISDFWKRDQFDVIKGNLRSKKKLSSNERARKMKNNEPSPTSMRQMVLEIFHFKVRNLSNMDVAIL